MGNLFGNIFGKKSADSASDKAQPQEQLDGKISDETLSKIIEAIKAETETPCMKIVLKDGSPSFAGSKLGGLPYIPHDGNFPLDSQGKQMKLLAQIDCNDISLQGFPANGLLQFFVASNRLFGLNTAAPTEQTGFAVRYYETVDATVTEDEVKSKVIADEDAKPRFPLKGGAFAIELLPETDFISAGDFRFEQMLADKANALCPNCGIKSLFDLTEEQQRQISAAFSGSGSKISGFPHFAQDDPRCVADKNLQSFETLLLQLDSDDENIIWGDSGTGNFFIEPAMLAECDFSRVLYNWDCL